VRLPWEELEPASRSTIERQRRAVLRLERLTDCVFSAAVFALVLIPAFPYLSGVADGPSTWRSLLEMCPAALPHVFSVFALFALWTLHHYEFHYLTRASGALAWLNAALLLLVAATPVTASLLDGFASSGLTVLLYSANLLATLLLLLLIWRHASVAGLLFGSDIPRRTVERMRTALRCGAAAQFVGTALAPVAPNVALAITATVFIAYAVVTGRGGYTLELRRSRTPSADS
jgi:uncharacterized membrane protein